MTVVAVVEVPVDFWRCFSAAAAALAVTVAGLSGPLAALRFLSLADTAAAAAGGVKTRMKIGVVARNAAAAGAAVEVSAVGLSHAQNWVSHCSSLVWRLTPS